MKNQRGLQGVQRLLISQAGVTIVIALTAAYISGYMAFKSAMLGGIVSILPTAYFARMLFHYQGARAAKKIVNNFYKGEAVKMVLTIVLFASVFALFNIVPIVFFLTYIVAQMMFWFAPLVFKNKPTRPKSD